MRTRNPFGSDAETVRYAADQVNLPSLATQLRRIAGSMATSKAAPIPDPSPTAAGRSPETMRPNEITDGAQSPVVDHVECEDCGAYYHCHRCDCNSPEIVYKSPAPVAPQTRPEPETLGEATAGWIAWCERRGMAGVSEHIRKLAALVPSGQTSNAETGAAVDDRDARDAARWRWIEENAHSVGGGSGFTLSVFVPHDMEDWGCAIDSAMKEQP